MMRTVLLLLIVMSTSYASPLIVTDPLNLAKNTIAAEHAVKQYILQAQQYHAQLTSINNQLKNLQRLSHLKKLDLNSLTQQLEQINQSSKSLSQSGSQVIQKFQSLYRDDASSNGVASRREDVTDEILKSLASLEEVNRSVTAEIQHYQYLSLQSGQVNGQLEALQLSHELSQQQLNQLQLLKRLIGSYMRSQQHYLAKQLADEREAEKVESDIVEHLSLSYPVYREKANYGLIKPLGSRHALS